MQFLRHFLLLTITVTCSFSAQPEASAISDLNRELLAKQKAGTAYQNGPKVTAAPVSEPMARPSFTDRISFLSDGQLTVMIPKGAMIHLPDKGRISISERIQGKLVEWDEFFLANRNAIRLQPVDAEQLQGTKPLDPKVLEHIKRVNFPALASYQNRVVSLPQSTPSPVTPSAP
jgi:hypothetical protein